MCEKFKVFWKSLTGEGNTFSAIWKLICTTVGYVSSFFTFALLLNDLAGFDKLEVWCRDYWVFLICGGFLVSVIKNRDKTSYVGTMRNDDSQIEVSVEDLFSVRASSFVIPTNTFFRTKMDGEYISPDSVQGVFQLKYFKDDFESLDRLIEASLEEQKLPFEAANDKFGKVRKYPIGSVAKVDYNGKHYYFVALNDVNDFGKPEHQDYSNIETALNDLFETIKKIGHCDDLAMPLIGTGRAAIREATIEKVIQSVVDSFLNTEDKIARKLIVCIRPKDYLERIVNLKNIKDCISYKCGFKERYGITRSRKL